MPLAGFEPTIPVFKWARTFHPLDRAATVTGRIRYCKMIKSDESGRMEKEPIPVSLPGIHLEKRKKPTKL
jgi:hypothetical protein